MSIVTRRSQLSPVVAYFGCEQFPHCVSQNGLVPAALHVSVKRETQRAPNEVLIHEGNAEIEPVGRRIPIFLPNLQRNICSKAFQQLPEEHSPSADAAEFKFRHDR